MATSIGILLALFGASGVFGQLQDALNTIWGVKAKPGAGIVEIHTRSFPLLCYGGRCLFLTLVSLVLESVLKSFSHYVQAMFPGGIVIALVVYSIFDLGVVVLLFALHLQISPRRENSMARRLDRRAHDCDILCHREMGARSLSRQRGCGFSLWSGELVNHAPPLDLLFIANSALRR